jgi:RNA polymerase sigma factor (sigma-70 family)
MNGQTDAQLLHTYAESRSEAAFNELVRRHVDFVYSAARRMVCDTHLAEDVTQGVFVALAKSASHLIHRPVLSGWLHRTTQNIAAQTVRTIERRRDREKEAATMNELLFDESEPSWEHIAPHLDAALGELSDSDRDALFLRYFERKSAHDMAAALGVSDEAAQKRVNRAVERLRELFAKRGVTTGTTVLVILISAKAVQSAPAGLAISISAAAALAGTAVATTTTVTATKAIAMTAIQKTTITAALAVAVGAGVYEANRAASAHAQVRTLQQEQAPLADKIQQLQRDRDDTTRQLASLREENGRLNNATAELLRLRAQVAALQSAARQGNQADTNPTMVAANAWVEKVNILKKWVEERPEEQNPEFPYLWDYDWLDVVKTSNMLGPYAPRNAISELREHAKAQFAHALSDALNSFVEKNNGDLPTELAQLNAYLEKPMNDTLLNSYQLVHTGRFADLPENESVVREIAPARDESDSFTYLIRPGKFDRTLRKK